MKLWKKIKQIQELKNELTLLNKKFQKNSGAALQVKELELELKVTKKKLDEEYIRSSRSYYCKRKRIRKIKRRK